MHRSVEDANGGIEFNGPMGTRWQTRAELGSEMGTAGDAATASNHPERVSGFVEAASRALEAMGMGRWEAFGSVAVAMGTDSVADSWMAFVAGFQVDFPEEHDEALNLAGRTTIAIVDALDGIATISPDVANDLLGRWLSRHPLLGTLDLSERPWVRSLPTGTSLIRGSLELAHCIGLEALPQGLAVAHRLNVSGCSNLRELPDGLSVGTGLNASHCLALTHIPDGLDIRGLALFDDCASLESLPSVLRADCVSARDCHRLARIPNGVTARRHLDLSGCRALVEIPSSVPGDLTLEYCEALDRLPERLNVGGSIFLHRCRLRLQGKGPSTNSWGSNSADGEYLTFPIRIQTDVPLSGC